MQKDKRDCIIQSALQLIYERGFHDSPVSLVAKNAGVAAGTIYTYFENKDALILEINKYVAKLIMEYISSRDEQQLSFEKRFFAYWNNLKEFYELYPEIHGFYDQFVNSPFNSEEVQNSPNPWYEWAHQFFQSGVDSGEIKNINPTIVAIMVNTNVNSIVRISINYKNKLAKSNTDLSEIPTLIWDGIKQS